MAVMLRHTRTAVLASLALAATVVLLVLGAGTAAAQDAESLYIENCSQCHQADGSGTPPVFPPLAGNPHVEDAAYVADVIRNGREGEIEVLGVTYNAQMPAVEGLSDAEIDAIVTYVQTVLQEADEPAPTTTLPPPDEPIEGVAFEEAAQAGRRLFAGWQGFENGGPACLE